MSNSHKSKTNFLWLILTAIIFMFKETNKIGDIKESIKKPERSSFDLIFIDNKDDLKKVNGNNWVILADYKSRHSHINTIQFFITKANVAVLYVDSLEKASIANKFNLKIPNKVYFLDKKKYIENLKIEIFEEMNKIKNVKSTFQRSKYLKSLRKRLYANKLSKFDERYHFENIDLLICFKLRLLNKFVSKLVLTNKSSFLFLTFVITNLVNSFFFLIK
ncbi:hypothetical protein NGRA_0654 [Nosema granulosis]|uniref:Uncharacterized protein n=1 Tax=Nosema granulosis TaxID=83296 RepID=A0A9P6GZY7_9MICR|nr:hypothetical protein NGRA_0654 [Nosema granulosis]